MQKQTPNALNLGPVWIYTHSQYMNVWRTKSTVLVGYHDMPRFIPGILITFEFPLLPTMVSISSIAGVGFFQY